MATTESSAIVRFIEIQQQKGIESTREPTPEPVVDSFKPAPVMPITRVSKQPARPITTTPSSGAGRWVAGAVVVGGLIAGGLYLGRNQLFGSGGPGGSEPVAGTVSLSGAIAMTEREHSADDVPPVAAKPAEGAERTVAQTEQQAERTIAMDPIAQPAHPTAEVKPLAVGSDMTTRPTAVTAPQTSPETGFDLRVKPAGAKVFLDGKPIGIAPLRVRNVVAGTHAVDIEAPEGYFSQHIELAVELDKPQQMRLELAPVDGPPAVTAAAVPMVADSAVAPVKPSSRHEEREAQREAQREARHERRERAKAERAANRELAKVAAAAAVSTPKSEPKSEPAPPEASEVNEVKAAPAPTAALAGSGTLRVGAKPPCKIFVDGKDTGLMTPQRALPMSAGKHSVKLVNQEFGINKTMRVRIAAGRSTTVIKDFSSSAGL